MAAPFDRLPFSSPCLGGSAPPTPPPPPRPLHRGKALLDVYCFVCTGRYLDQSPLCGLGRLFQMCRASAAAVWCCLKFAPAGRFLASCCSEVRRRSWVGCSSLLASRTDTAPMTLMSLGGRVAECSGMCRDNPVRCRSFVILYLLRLFVPLVTSPCPCPGSPACLAVLSWVGPN